MSISSKYTVSYAQNREDIIIGAFFPDVRNGYYIDIGANDPVDDSVTLIFYKKGWTGLNIEPNKDLFEKLQKLRPKDKNLNIGVSSKEGRLKLRLYSNHGLSTFSEEVKEEHMLQKSDKTNSYEDVTIPVKRLESVLNEYKPKKIHFMKVDVEGFEYEVLESMDWKNYRPELLCIESNHIKRDWRPILKKAKYEKVFFDGINDYYLAQESINRLKNFDYAKTFLLGKPIISPGIEKQLRNLEMTEVEAKLMRDRLTLIEAQYEEAIRQRNELFLQLQRFHGFRRQLRMLLETTYDRLYRKADALSYSSSQTFPTQKISTNSNRENLLKRIANYDNEVLIEKRVVGPKWRRWTSWFLKKCLILPKRIIRITISLLRKLKLKAGSA